METGADVGDVRHEALLGVFFDEMTDKLPGLRGKMVEAALIAKHKLLLDFMAEIGASAETMEDVKAAAAQQTAALAALLNLGAVEARKAEGLNLEGSTG